MAQKTILSRIVITAPRSYHEHLFMWVQHKTANPNAHLEGEPELIPADYPDNDEPMCPIGHRDLLSINNTVQEWFGTIITFEITPCFSFLHVEEKQRHYRSMEGYVCHLEAVKPLGMEAETWKKMVRFYARALTGDYLVRGSDKKIYTRLSNRIFKLVRVTHQEVEFDEVTEEDVNIWREERAEQTAEYNRSLK